MGAYSVLSSSIEETPQPETSCDAAIRAVGLQKAFKGARALDGVDLEVPAGTLCSLLGPNGAGKTTVVRILSTLLRLDGGRAEVAGFDVARDPAEVRRRIGFVGQESAVDDLITGRQNLELVGRLYHLAPAVRRRRAAELLEQFGLEEDGERKVKHYSGGMRRRLDLAVSFILAPAVLFLDEPTTGLDPRHRMEVWQAVRSLLAAGTTVLLTTHYLDEADQLADHICVLDHGRVIASDTPGALKARIGGSRVELVLQDDEALAQAADVLARVTGGPPLLDRAARRATAEVADPVLALAALLRALEDVGVVPQDLALRRPTLDEVFLHLTGGATPTEAAA
jgi:ABC-2 type transport system ATP-binding protein